MWRHKVLGPLYLNSLITYISLLGESYSNQGLFGGRVAANYAADSESRALQVRQTVTVTMLPTFRPIVHSISTKTRCMSLYDYDRTHDKCHNFKVKRSLKSFWEWGTFSCSSSRHCPKMQWATVYTSYFALNAFIRWAEMIVGCCVFQVLSWQKLNLLNWAEC